MKPESPLWVSPRCLAMLLTIAVSASPHTHSASAHSFLTPLLAISVYPIHPSLQTPHTQIHPNTAHTPVPFVSSHTSHRNSVPHLPYTSVHGLKTGHIPAYFITCSVSLFMVAPTSAVQHQPILLVWMASAECLPLLLSILPPLGIYA